MIIVIQCKNTQDNNKLKMSIFKTGTRQFVGGLGRKWEIYKGVYQTLAPDSLWAIWAHTQG